MTVPDDYRKEARARWATQARGWGTQAERMARITMPVSVWMVDAIGLQPGHEVLELAAGTGEVGFLAAEQIAPGGTLISSDFVPEMITVAQARAERLGISNVRFRQIDAESIDQPAASLDGVLCRWGYMLMADAEAALRETRRVLRPGGRVALSAWDAAEHNPWLARLGRVMIERGLMQPEPPGTPGPLAFAVPGRIEELLDAAGFDDVEVQAIDLEFHAGSLDEWWDQAVGTSGRFSRLVAQLSPAEHYELRDAVDAAYAEFVQADGSLAVPGRALVAAASA
jgi:SAM-dependent methyltransferase